MLNLKLIQILVLFVKFSSYKVRNFLRRKFKKHSNKIFILFERKFIFLRMKNEEDWSLCIVSNN